MKGNIKTLWLSLSLLVVSYNLYAQDMRKITLQEAVELSLQNSKQLKLSQYKQSENDAMLREAKEKRLPELSVTGAYMRLTQPNFDLKVPLGSSGQSQQGEGAGTSTMPTVNQAMYGMASASLPLFSGFRVQNGIASAKYLQKASELDVVKNRNEVILNTISAYSNLYKAKAALEIVKENLKQSKQRVADMTNLEQNGLLASNDLLKAKLQQSNMELALLDAENNWKITYINMNLMLGLDENTLLEPDGTDFVGYNDDHTFNYWENLALTSRPDVQALEFRKKAANSSVKIAKGAYYPSIALTGGYVALNVPDFLTATNIINGGIGVNYSPSSLWHNGAKVAQAKARLHQTELSQDMLSDAVRLEVAQAYQQYLVAVKKIDVYETAVQQAQENYKIVKNKYDNSLATVTELLDADVARLSADLNYAFAKADAYVAFNKLKQVSGMIENNRSNQ